MTLDMMRRGESGVVADLRGGHGVTRRLIEMGIVPGVSLRLVIDSGRAGPVIVQVGDARVGLGRGMARRVLVRPDEA
ncbi:MAG: ferrous iron transport protein A [candidate division WS1 bacterium]|jgi:ferrous iron transport protein A|nr:ferrous iron transport protein A [candidate division WS1 bacterium]